MRRSFSFRADLFRRAFPVLLALAIHPATDAAVLPKVQIDAPVIPGERASAWLLRTVGPLAPGESVHWRAHSAIPAQSAFNSEVLSALGKLSHLSLQQRLQALPVTGRIALKSGVARSLQVMESSDPILNGSDRMVWFGALQMITVLDSEGGLCSVSHRSGALAADYLEACALKDVSRAWVVQPDAQVLEVGAAPWTIQSQVAPTAGAWIFAPRDSSRLPARLAQSVAKILATQPPAETFVQDARAVSLDRVRVGVWNAHDHGLTANDWGEIGLLQSPSARMAPAGTVRFSMSRVSPYTRGNVFLQPIDGLEFGFRYTDIADSLYGPEIAGSQSYKDKSIDFKLRLLQESKHLPQLALGVRDLGGTGFFSGEYLVASKRYGNWDASLGLGWGYLGARGNVSNPFGLFGDRWKTRPDTLTGQGGIPALQSFFRGPTALFGGVQYQPNSQWIFKFELDGNDYLRDRTGKPLQASSPLNVGVVYRFNPFLDLSLGLERGNSLMLGFSVHTGPSGLQGINTPKTADPPLAPLNHLPAAQNPGRDPGLPLQASAIEALRSQISERTGWALREITLVGQTGVVHIETNAGVHARYRLESTIHLLHAALPADIRQFKITLSHRELPLASAQIDREAWLLDQTRPTGQASGGAGLMLRPPEEKNDEAQARLADARRPEITSNSGPAAMSKPTEGLEPGAFVRGISPTYQQILGGPDGFLLFKIGAQAGAQWRISKETWVSGGVEYRLIDNFDKFKYTAPSELPRVRTYMREYMTSTRFTIPNLQVNHLQSLGHGHYVSAYGGLLEPMFGGVGGEWLWRRWNSPIAIGADLNFVRQREFEQDFQFRDYRVTTGHLRVYWDTGWEGVHASLMVGQYLAGDRGATLDLRRRFQNGVAIGAWATKTNVSSAQFGEGSFDKGIYVSIPFDIMMTRSTSGTGHVIWTPLTRDGGARLNRAYQLEAITRQGSESSWSIGPGVSR